MEEIRSSPRNGFKVASTFAGGGGSSTGYRMAGFDIVWANEFVEAARDTYRANANPSTIIDGRDIRDITGRDVLDAIGMEPGELDIFDGSPPCKSFSTAGKRAKGWGEVDQYSDTAQRSDDLFFEYARLLDEIRPRVFVAENVSGLVKGVAKGYFLQILKVLKGCGYVVEARLLDAQWLGVPQARQRLIFVGVRADLAFQPSFPDPLGYRYSIRDVLPWVQSLTTKGHGFTDGGRQDIDKPAPTVVTSPCRAGYYGAQIVCGPAFPDPLDYRYTIRDALPWIKAGRFGRSGWQSSNRPSTTVSASLAWNPETSAQGLELVEAESDISRYAIGQEWDKLKAGGQSDKYFQLVKPDENQPCPTITAAGGSGSIAGVTHPTEKRKFSIAELKRICGFPDDYIVHGSYEKQWERLGRAVPPVMMSHIASAIRDKILTPCAE